MRIERMLCLATLVLGACQPRSCSEPGAAASKERLTTDAKIALQNLNAQIEEQERAHARSPEVLQFTATLVGLLETRAQYLGRVSDYRRALALAEEATDRAPENPEALLSRASARTSLHQFSPALSDLDRAAALGAEPDAVAQLRASILQERGNLTEALALWRRLASSSPDIRVLGSLAVAEGENGNRSEAERLFSAAVQRYRDVSPFPLAWIELRQGQMWERAGELAKAQRHYELARFYLPQYAPATGHLAELLALRGKLQQALELLRPLADSCEDPEYAGVLAAVLAQLDRAKQATDYRRSARERYDLLARRYPEAFADHAARFFLSEDPPRALALARQNLANRRTGDAFDLAISAALAAQQTALACEMAEQALALQPTSSRLHLHVNRAYQECGRLPRSEAQRDTVLGSSAVR